MANLLVAECGEIHKRLLSHFLARAGQTVSTASSDEEATAKLRENCFDLITINPMRSDRNGLELCKTVRSSSLTDSIPVIFLKSLSDDKSREREFRSGCNALITMPYEMASLLEAIEVALQGTITRECSDPSGGDKVPGTDSHDI